MKKKVAHLCIILKCCKKNETFVVTFRRHIFYLFPIYYQKEHNETGILCIATIIRMSLLLGENWRKACKTVFDMSNQRSAERNTHFLSITLTLIFAPQT